MQFNLLSIAHPKSTACCSVFLQPPLVRLNFILPYYAAVQADVITNSFELIINLDALTKMCDLNGQRSRALIRNAKQKEYLKIPGRFKGKLEIVTT